MIDIRLVALVVRKLIVVSSNDLTQDTGMMLDLKVSANV